MNIITYPRSGEARHLYFLQTIFITIFTPKFGKDVFAHCADIFTDWTYINKIHGGRGLHGNNRPIENFEIVFQGAKCIQSTSPFSCTAVTVCLHLSN